MTKEKPLYEDEQIKIDYLPSSIEDHLLYIKEKSGEESRYLMERGILSELARTSRGGIERKIATINQSILFTLREEKIGIDGLHVALCQAYAEEERRINEFSRHF